MSSLPSLPLMPAGRLQPLKPRPSNEQAEQRSKPVKSAPRKAYAGPLVFVNTSRDPDKEDEKRHNRRMVKKWAMLNRTNTQAEAQPTRATFEVMTWDLGSGKEGKEQASLDDDDSETSSPKSGPSTADVSKELILAPRVEPLAANPVDPFDSLPVKGDLHTHELVHFFLTGGGNRAHASRGRASAVRRNSTWSIFLRSKAAFCSLVCVLELSPEVPLRSDKPSYFRNKFTAALQETNALLVKTHNGVDEDVFFSVDLLIWVAHFMGDTQALRAHGNGIAALMSRHWHIFSRYPFFRGGALFWSIPTNEGNVVPDLTYPAGLTRHDDFFILRQPGFDMLNRLGLVSQALVDMVPHLLRMDELVARGKANLLSVLDAKELLSYILYNARTLFSLRTSSFGDVEDCIRQAMTIFFYADIFLNADVGVGWVHESIHEKLLKVDTRSLLMDCPQVLLWLCLIVGPFSEGPAYDFFFNLMVQARQAVPVVTFAEATTDIAARYFLWTSNLDASAEIFWNAVTTYLYPLSITPVTTASDPFAQLWAT